MAQLGQNVPASAGGAWGSPATESPKVQEMICKHTKQLIEDLKSDMYLAVRMDEFMEMLAGRVNAELEALGKEPIKIDDEFVMDCIYREENVKVYRYGKYVLWLWHNEVNVLISMILYDAYKHGAVLAEIENPDKYYDDCGVLGCDKGDDDAQVEYVAGE
jgi:hypothetical protein